MFLDNLKQERVSVANVGIVEQDTAQVTAQTACNRTQLTQRISQRQSIRQLLVQSGVEHATLATGQGMVKTQRQRFFMRHPLPARLHH